MLWTFSALMPFNFIGRTQLAWTALAAGVIPTVLGSFQAIQPIEPDALSVNKPARGFERMPGSAEPARRQALEA